MTLTTPSVELSEESPNRAKPRSRTRSPLRRWIRWTVAADTFAMALATGFAMFVRFGTTDATEGNVSYVAIGLAATVAWPALLGLSGAYDLRSSLFGVEELRRVLRAALLLLASAGLAHIGFRLNLSRGYFLALLPTAVVVTAAARSAVRRVLSRPGDDLRSHRVVAVGPADDIVRFCEDLDRTQTRGQVEVVAFVADDLAQTQAAPPALRAMQRLPDRNAIRDVATHVDVDMLVRAGRPGPDEMWALGQRAHDLGVTVAIAPHRDDATSSVALTYVPLGSTPLLMVENPTLRPAAVLVKAVFDRSAALVLMIVLAPVFAAIALTIAVRDGRPVFFRQERVGRYGTRFSCWKFRTMHVDAEQRRDELLGRNEASGLLFKVKDDPRVTPTGRLLRRHSLDELPQLLNVLTGQMSIVGPRPPLPYEVEAYDARTHRRLNVKPGITGLWQTQGRSNLPWDDGIYLDLLYIDHWSPLLDLVIMARTVRTVIRPEGAY